MEISEINKLLSAEYKSIDEFEKFSSWENIKGKSLTSSFVNEFSHKIDWEYFSKNYILSEETIEFNHTNLNWQLISKHQKLSENFIRKFQNKVSWDQISCYQILSENFIIEFKNNLNWKYISEYQLLSESFIDKFQDKVNWYYISTKQKLSENFIRLNQSKLNWSELAKHQKLSESFIDEFQDKLNWITLLEYQILSVKFIEKHIQKLQETVYWNQLLKFQKLPEDFVLKHIYEFSLDTLIYNYKLKENIIEELVDNCSDSKLDYLLINILIYQDVSNDFILKYKRKIDWRQLTRTVARYHNNPEDKLIDRYIDFLDWNDSISYYYWNKKITIDFLRKYQNKINWTDLCHYGISEDFFKEFQYKLDWSTLSRNLSEDLIIKYQEKVNWITVSREIFLSEEFIEKFENKIVWEVLATKHEYSISFIKKYKHRLKNALITTDNSSLVLELKDSISFSSYKINYLDFSDEILFKIIDKVSWESLIFSRKLSETLIEKGVEFFTKKEWEYLSDKQPLSIDFIKKYHDKVHWGGICFYQNFSHDEIEYLATEFNDEIWWGYIYKYQNLSSEFAKKMANENYKKSRYLMLPYQKNSFTAEVLNSLSEEEKEKYLKNTWLYKTTTFRKEQVFNLKLFECFDLYFYSYIIIDKNKYIPRFFHFKFEKDKTLEIFATQTQEDRTKGFIVGSENALSVLYRINVEKEEYFPIKVKVYYEDIVGIEYFERYKLIRCKKLTVLE